MEERPGQRRRRRPSATTAALLGIIAVAGTAGIVISVGQRPASSVAAPAPALPRIPLHPTPSPMPADPQAGALFAVADDLATHDVVLFGGVGDFGNTWLWNGVRWRLAQPATSPPDRFGASAAYDPQTKTALLFGGRNELGIPVHDTWAWDGTTWQDLDSGAGGPPPGQGSDMAWDSAHNQMVLVTGSGIIGSAGSTWVWDGTHWRHPPGSDLPAAASYSPMWFDPVTGSLIAVGCCEGPPPATGAANTTWRWDGARWDLLPATAGVPIDGSTMALDPAIHAVVLCTCAASGRLKPALLAWNGSDWQPRSAGAIPVAAGVEITDADRGQLLLLGSPMGGIAPGAVPVQVWALRGSTWIRIDVKPS